MNLSEFDFKHGLIAVTSSEIIHFCGYLNPPTNFDKEDLVRELQTNPEFGLVGRTDYAVISAPHEVVQAYRQKAGEIKP